MSSSRWSIGRAPDNNVVINHASVSGHHAELEALPDGRYRLRDLRSRNGTFVTRPDVRIEEVELSGDEVLWFSAGYKVPLPLLLQQARGGAASHVGQQLTIDRDLVRIGRAPDNDVRLGQLTASRHHAEIRRGSDGTLWLRDLGSKFGTRVGSRIIRGEEVALGRDELVEICGEQISLVFAAEEARKEARVAVNRSGYTLQLDGLRYDLPGGRTLVHPLDLVVYPGELVAIMGPSGCGKSTLLNLCCGEFRPSAGRVVFSGTDLQSAPESILPFVGHVPQEDLYNPDLTVEEVLWAHARIRIGSDVAADEIAAKVTDVCESIGLLDTARGVDLRRQLIGSSERKGLSGGQKKRVGLAMELLSDPRIVFLDEPTSGLSSQDARQVIQVLRKVSLEKGVPIVVTIHQPSLAVYRLFDKAVFMKEGRLAYFGPAFPEAVRFFVPEAPAEQAGPDGIMEVLDLRSSSDLAAAYATSPFARAVEERRATERVSEIRGEEAVGRQSSLVTQFSTVFRRDLRSKSRDRQYLAILVAQPVFIGLLVGAVCYDPGSSDPDRAVIAFLVALISYWFGINLSARDLVAERPRIRRERRGGLSALAYVSAKAVSLALIASAQTALLLVILGVTIQELIHPITLGNAGWVAAVSIAVSVCGVGSGLVTSTVARTEIQAVTFVPLQLIPAIVFGGLLKPFREMVDLFKLVSNANPLRWAYEALGYGIGGARWSFSGTSGATVTVALAVLAVLSLLSFAVACRRVKSW